MVQKDARIFPSFAQFSFWPWVKGTHFEGSPHWQGVLLQRTLPFSAHSILWSHTKAHWGIKPNHPIIHSPSSRQWRLPFVARTFRRRQMSRFAFSKASIINSTWSMQYQCTVFCSSPVQFHSAYWTTGLHDLGGFKSSTLTKAHARLSDSVTAPTFWDFEDRLSAFRKIQEKHNCYVHVAGHSLGKNRQFQWVQCGPQTSRRVQALSQRQRHWLLHQPSRIAEMLLLSCDPLCTTASQYHPKVNSLCPICGLHRWPLLPRPCFLPGRQMEASRTDRTSRPKLSLAGWILSWILSWPQRHGFCALGPGGFRFSSARLLADQILPDRRAPIWSSKTFALQKEVTRWQDKIQLMATTWYH